MVERKIQFHIQKSNVSQYIVNSSHLDTTCYVVKLFYKKDTDCVCYSIELLMLLIFTDRNSWDRRNVFKAKPGICIVCTLIMQCLCSSILIHECQKAILGYIVLQIESQNQRKPPLFYKNTSLLPVCSDACEAVSVRTEGERGAMLQGAPL